MPVMDVRDVRMFMLERRVCMPVRVRFRSKIPRQVSVLMMLIVHVTVIVFQGLVCV